MELFPVGPIIIKAVRQFPTPNENTKQRKTKEVLYHFQMSWSAPRSCWFKILFWLSPTCYFFLFLGVRRVIPVDVRSPFRPRFYAHYTSHSVIDTCDKISIANQNNGYAILLQCLICRLVYKASGNARHNFDGISTRSIISKCQNHALMLSQTKDLFPLHCREQVTNIHKHTPQQTRIVVLTWQLRNDSCALSIKRRGTGIESVRWIISLDAVHEEKRPVKRYYKLPTQLKIVKKSLWHMFCNENICMSACPRPVW